MYKNLLIDSRYQKIYLTREQSGSTTLLLDNTVNQKLRDS